MIERIRSNIAESNFYSLDLKLRQDKETLQSIIEEVFGKQKAKILEDNFFSLNKPPGGHQRDVDEAHTIHIFIAVLNDFSVYNFGLVNGQKKLSTGYTIDGIGKVQAMYLQTKWPEFLQRYQSQFGELESLIESKNKVE